MNRLHTFGESINAVRRSYGPIGVQQGCTTDVEHLVVSSHCQTQLPRNFMLSGVSTADDAIVHVRLTITLRFGV